MQNWYIRITKENRDELLKWWEDKVGKSDYGAPKINQYLMSENPEDDSYYWSQQDTDKYGLDWKRDYELITLEQFRKITNPSPKQDPMSETTAIQISRNLLNEYYEASTNGQKAFLSEHFKLDGSTTVGAIRKLYDIACSEWKLKIKANHPDCFEPESKEFDFGKYVAKGSKCILKANAGEELGLCNNFIQIRVDHHSDYYHKGFYLDSEYNWELITDNKNEIVLVPTKK